MNATTTDMDLRQVWHAMTAAGATVYEVCEGGVATGEQAVKAGDEAMIVVSGQNGYDLMAGVDFDDYELIPADQYDEEAAVREASDVIGWFGVVGIPGSAHHQFRWFEEEAEASVWARDAARDTQAANPALRGLYHGAEGAEKLYKATWRDGSRIYFRPKPTGQAGYEPRAGGRD